VRGLAGVSPSLLLCEQDVLVYVCDANEIDDVSLFFIESCTDCFFEQTRKSHLLPCYFLLLPALRHTSIIMCYRNGGRLLEEGV